jgi:transposase-like protein
MKTVTPQSPTTPDMTRTLGISSPEDYSMVLANLKGARFSGKQRRKIRNFFKATKNITLKKGIDSLRIYVDDKVVIPKHDEEARTRVFQHFHDESNHCGRDVLYARISKHYYGISKEDVRDYLRKCTVCRGV